MKKLDIMDKSDKSKLVQKAEAELIEEMTAKVYYMLGTAQKAQLIQDKLPTKPLYCLAKITKILNGSDK